MAEPRVLPSFMYDEPEPDWSGDWMKPDPREERLRELDQTNRRQLEDEPA